MRANEEVLESLDEDKKIVAKAAVEAAKQEKMNELMRQLIDATTVLVVKVAACDCKKKASCKVFNQAQAIAKVIDELQELRPH